MNLSALSLRLPVGPAVAASPAATATLLEASPRVPLGVGMAELALAARLGIHPLTPGFLASSRQVLPGPAPYFTQLQPLPNAEVNCVPTSVAMVLTKLNPALAAQLATEPETGAFQANRLIHALSSWMVQRQGGLPGLRDFGVLATLLEGLGVPAEAVHGVPLQSIRLALALGRQAIVMGDANALPSSPQALQARAGRTDALHAIVVTAQDPRTGMLLINDPQDPAHAPRWMTEGQLATFITAVQNNIDGAPIGSVVLVG